MNKKEKNIYSSFAPVAVYPLSNWGGIELLEITGDYVVWRFNYGEPQPPHRVKINICVNTTSFRAGHLTIKLNECMRL